MLEKLTSRFAAISFAVAGGVALALCGGYTFCEMAFGAIDPTNMICETELEAQLAAPLASDKEAQLKDAQRKTGQLQVLGIWPTQTSINRNICVVVGGVVSKSAETRLADEVTRAQKARDDAQAKYDGASEATRDADWAKLQQADTALAAAFTAAARQPQPVALSVFLNGKTIPDLAVTAYAKSDPQILLIRLKVPNNAEESSATFWRELLSATTTVVKAAKLDENGKELKADEDKTEFGQKLVNVGLSRATATMPEATSDTTLTIVVYNVWVLGIGIISFLCFALCFCGLAKRTTMLRDNKQTENAPQLAADALTAQKADADAKTKAKDAADMATAARTAAETDAKAVADAVANGADDATKAAAKEAATKTADALKIADAAAAAATAAANDAAAALKVAQTRAVYATKTGDVEQPVGPYSLARTQMAFWMFLTIAGFIFIWLTTGIYLGMITGGILVLLGINAASGLTAISLNGEEDKTSTSKSFFQDILNEGKGPALHRIQAVAWTCILGIIFMWNVLWSFTFVNFDTNLLLLIGVAQSMYLGFKTQEAPGK